MTSGHRFCHACGEPLPAAGPTAKRRDARESAQVERTVDDYLKAVSTFERMLHGQGHSTVRSLLARGDALNSLGEAEASAHAYEQALELDPDSIEARLALGRLYNRLARYRDALTLCDEVLARAPNSEEVYLIKARALLASGDFQGIVDLEASARKSRVASAALTRVAELARRRYREVQDSHAVVQEIFVIHKSTRLLAHRSRLFRPQVDSDLVAGTLRAIQDFIQVALMGEQAGAPALDELRYGSFIVRVESRDLFQVAFVVSGTPDRAMLASFREAAETIGKNFDAVLEDWDGAIDRVRGVQAFLNARFFADLAEGEVEDELEIG